MTPKSLKTNTTSWGSARLRPESKGVGERRKEGGGGVRRTMILKLLLLAEAISFHWDQQISKCHNIRRNFQPTSFHAISKYFCSFILDKPV